eukprot:m.705691 g.705691  ORF g.705691 m.705691 type:complete len:184 (-) comp22928_c0_seq11:40-591(-)
MEVLRLWSIIPAGTFRELQFDDYIRGPGGTQVKIPKGTPVQIPTWCRHRDPQLWGPDVAEFNPDRHFDDVEIWDNDYKAYNPASRRFSPFTLQPRDCIGRNFAQMEMRTILSNLFRNFTFTLTPTYANHDPIGTGLPIEYNSGVMVRCGCVRYDCVFVWLCAVCRLGEGCNDQIEWMDLLPST